MDEILKIIDERIKYFIEPTADEECDYENKLTAKGMMMAKEIILTEKKELIEHYCDDCKHWDTNINTYPCSSCKHACIDKYEKKDSE